MMSDPVLFVVLLTRTQVQRLDATDTYPAYYVV